jgi:ABC-type ATPase with predicted acetyltransferase domain
LTLDLAMKLDVDEVHDLGLQLVHDTSGEEFTAYVTVAFWRCEKCDVLLEVVSKTECRLLLELSRCGLENVAKARLHGDTNAVERSRKMHHCSVTTPESP